METFQQLVSFDLHATVYLFYVMNYGWMCPKDSCACAGSFVPRHNSMVGVGHLRGHYVMEARLDVVSVIPIGRTMVPTRV